MTVSDGGPAPAVLTVAQIPAFVDDLPPGPLRARLAPIVEVRALRAQLTVSSMHATALRRNGTGKTVAAVDIHDELTLGSGQRLSVPWSAEVVPYEGYDKAAGQAARVARVHRPARLGRRPLPGGGERGRRRPPRLSGPSFGAARPVGAGGRRLPAGPRQPGGHRRRQLAGNRRRHRLGVPPRLPDRRPPQPLGPLPCQERSCRPTDAGTSAPSSSGSERRRARCGMPTSTSSSGRDTSPRSTTTLPPPSGRSWLTSEPDGPRRTPPSSVSCTRRATGRS